MLIFWLFGDVETYFKLYLSSFWQDKVLNLKTGKSLVKRRKMEGRNFIGSFVLSLRREKWSRTTSYESVEVISDIGMCDTVPVSSFELPV
jgi:hypothetical protein